MEASWGRLGGVLAATWRVLAGSWGVVEASGGVLGASWGRLGASWRALPWHRASEALLKAKIELKCESGDVDYANDL